MRLTELLGSANDSRTFRMLPLALSVLLVSAGYYAGGVIGSLRGYPPSGIASIWLPTALLLAVFLLTPPRHWWLYVLSIVPAHLHLVEHVVRLNDERPTSKKCVRQRCPRNHQERERHAADTEADRCPQQKRKRRQAQYRQVPPFSVLRCHSS